MEKKLGIMFFLSVLLLLLQLSELCTAQRTSQVDKEEDKEHNNNKNWAWATQEDKESNMAQEFSHLMGEDKCEESNEECMRRRMMITETHLDYIYTQSHTKP